MTLEEILELVDHFTKYDDSYRREWQAAGRLIRAGHAMRSEIEIRRDLIAGIIPEVVHVSTYGLAYACEAWDKALGTPEGGAQ